MLSEPASKPVDESILAVSAKSFWRSRALKYDGPINKTKDKDLTI
jgi:hypothetical protein